MNCCLECSAKSFFARKRVLQSLQSHFSLENASCKVCKVIFRSKTRFAKSAKSFFARKRVLQSAGSHFSLENASCKAREVRFSFRTFRELFRRRPPVLIMVRHLLNLHHRLLLQRYNIFPYSPHILPKKIAASTKKGAEPSSTLRLAIQSLESWGDYETFAVFSSFCRKEYT